MRTFVIVTGFASILGAVTIALGTATAESKPTTQSCLGDFKTFLTCPAGAKVWGTECRAEEPKRGKGDDEHWSGSKRQGPALFLRDDNEKDPAKVRVSYAASFKDHKKQGRTFRFYEDGVLESWSDMASDDYHGASVDCTVDGRAKLVSHWKDGKSVGISLHWKVSDGAFSFAYDQGKRASVDVPAAMKVRPDHLCRPAKCDVSAKPDFSGVPK